MIDKEEVVRLADEENLFVLRIYGRGGEQAVTASASSGDQDGVEIITLRRRAFRGHPWRRID